MSILCALASAALILWTLMEAFEAMVLPRRVTRKFRFTRVFYRGNWSVWLCLARGFRAPKRRETFLSVFGPLSILALFSMWVVTLIAGFALLHWSLGTPLLTPANESGLSPLLYFSGITFFTIGYGDVVPLNGLGRFLAVVEGGVGFGFLAVVIGYMPVLYQAFSRREATISLFDARAGSPPSASQCLCCAWLPTTIAAQAMRCWRNGNAGRLNCWKAICPSRCSASIVRNTTINRGWRR